jgi:hypothetical protein
VEDVAEKVRQLCSGPARAEWAARVALKHGELTTMHGEEVSALRRLVSGR